MNKEKDKQGIMTENRDKNPVEKKKKGFFGNFKKKKANDKGSINLSKDNSTSRKSMDKRENKENVNVDLGIPQGGLKLTPKIHESRVQKKDYSNFIPEENFNKKESNSQKKGKAVTNKRDEKSFKPKKNKVQNKGNQEEKKPKNKKKIDKLKVIPIGGLNEIGKNMTLLEYKDQILIIDCGLSFPDDDMYGIDIVIPDFSYLEKNAKKVVGMVLTHGHEDHIGAIPYLLKKIKCPIYGTRITLGLVANKLKEHGINGDFHPFKAGDKFKIGNFKVETIRTTHSVADAVCLYIQTPVASLFHTGDFKIDYTPIDGEPIDLSKFAEIGKRGVDVMLADSTNVLRPGYTQSEKLVGEALDDIIRHAEGRIIIATFSSNVHRVQKIIELAHKYGRKFTVSGRSMENVVTLAEELGYLKIPKGSYVPLKQAHKVPDNEMVIITTGSQGEPMAALSRMANDEHKNIKLKKGDMVIFSSTPVPGNEKTVFNVVNRLYDKEVDVIYNDIADIHVSGHASQEELKLIHALIKPRFFMPVHGESRHLVKHAELAEGLGMKKEKVFILSNGDELSLNKRSANKNENVTTAEGILVDGLGIGDVGNVVLKDRKTLSESGLIIVSASINLEDGILVSKPEITSRGFIYVKSNAKLIKEMEELVKGVIEDNLDSDIKDLDIIKDNVRSKLRKFIFKKTERSPMIMPVFIEE